jgi:hypothetical protein
MFGLDSMQRLFSTPVRYTCRFGSFLTTTCGCGIPFHVCSQQLQHGADWQIGPVVFDDGAVSMLSAMPFTSMQLLPMDTTTVTPLL